MNIIAVGGVRWSDANCYIVVHSCFGGVCVSFILYQCWLVVVSRCKPSGMLCYVSGSVVPTISEALHSFFSTRKYWPTSTTSHPRRVDCTAALSLSCEPQILCHFGLFIIDLLLLTFWAPEYILERVPSVIAFEYQGWRCQMFAVYAMFVLYYCQHLHGCVTLLSWSKLLRCTV